MKRRFLLALFVASTASLSSSCSKHLYSANDLEMTAASHHIDLRWGKLDQAARAVHPDLRTAFLASWSSRLSQVELQNIEVAGTHLDEDGDGADVVVNVTWVDKATMGVQTTTVTERWVRTDSGWKVIRPTEL